MTEKQSKKVSKMVECGLFVAIGVILDTFFRLDAPWAYGGSITLCSMLPLVIISYRSGIKWGCLSGLTFGLITMMISGGRAGGLAAMIEDNGGLKIFLFIMLFDYILAFLVVGFSGLTKKWCKTPSSALSLGAVLGLSCRYIMHVFSGAMFFGSYAEWFFTEAVTAPWGKKVVESFSGVGLSMLYSLVYNGLYMIPEIILTAIAGALLGRVLNKQLN